MFDKTAYMADYMRKRRQSRRTEIIRRLGSKCCRCGSTQNLEIDHVDPNLKTGDVSRAQFLDGPMERLLREIAVCQLLCHDCHVSKSKDNKEFGGGHNKILDPKHGTAVMYEKCKCSDCREWKRLYREKKVDSLGRPRFILG